LLISVLKCSRKVDAITTKGMFILGSMMGNEVEASSLLARQAQEGRGECVCVEQRTETSYMGETAEN
jgi:hypothetical protein